MDLGNNKLRRAISAHALFGPVFCGDSLLYFAACNLQVRKLLFLASIEMYRIGKEFLHILFILSYPLTNNYVYIGKIMFW